MRLMARMKSFLAYTWALLAAPLVLATFMGMPFFAGRLVAVTDLHVHPVYTGGEVVRTIDHGPYRTLIHRPDFDGLIGRRNHGFVQLRWEPADANLPEWIDEPIDFDADGTSDFQIRLNTRTNVTDLKTSDPRVLSVGAMIPVENARILRINLLRVPPNKRGPHHDGKGPV
jgi:hypothetical protein